MAINSFIKLYTTEMCANPAIFEKVCIGPFSGFLLGHLSESYTHGMFSASRSTTFMGT